MEREKIFAAVTSYGLRFGGDVLQKKRPKEPRARSCELHGPVMLEATLGWREFGARVTWAAERLAGRCGVQACWALLGWSAKVLRVLIQTLIQG